MQTLTNPFNPGDVVALRSGGPLMTVAGLQGEKYITCTYFDKWGTMKVTEFNTKMLTTISRFRQLLLAKFG